MTGREPGTGIGGRSLADWIGQRAVTLDSLDAESPLDDLEPLRDLINDARVVAIGESAHHVGEFYLLRHRLLRFLVERCGFTHYAFETPAGESRAIDAWIQGGPGTIADAARTTGTQLADCREMHATLEWMRGRNHAAERVRFAGVLPGTGGASFAGELDDVLRYCERHDLDALPLLRQAVDLAASYADASVAKTLAGYAAMEDSARDALSAALSRLLDRMETLTAEQHLLGAGREHAQAMATLRRAWYLDHFTRDLTGHGLPVGPTAMDTSMAETVLRLLEDHGPDTRIVLGLHNVHIRRTPAVDKGPAGRFPAGYHLAQALGRDYVSIAATSGSGRTVRGNLDPQQPSGFAFQDLPLPAAPEGSIERAFSGGTPAAIADLRAAGSAVSDAEAYTSIRMEDYFADTPVLKAFDAVAHLADTTTTDYLSGP